MHVKDSYTLPVSQKGQVTIPVDIRKALGVDKTKKIIVQVISDKDFALKPAGLTLEDVYGSVKPIRKSFKEIRRIAREERAVKQVKKLK